MIPNPRDSKREGSGVVEKQNTLTWSLMAASLCLLLVMAVKLFPLIREVVTHVGDEAAIVAFVEAYGVRGVPILIGLSALQAILPFIPAPAVGILTGLCYGLVWGPLIVLSGYMLGTSFVFLSVREVRGKLRLYRKPKPKQNKLLSKEKLESIKRPGIVVFFCVLVPGVGSMTPYLFAETKISLPRYLLAAAAGNLPFIMMYVFLGERVSSGNYATAIVAAGLVLVAIVILLLFRKKIMEKVL